MSEETLLFFDIDKEAVKNAKPGELSKIQIVRTGIWNHPLYGRFEITKEDLSEMKQNFDDNAHRQTDDQGKPEVPLNYSHERGNIAGGWIKELILEDNGDKLFALTKFTPKGKQVVLDEEFKGISPEISRNFEDSETGKTFGALLKGAALTNIPYLKEMDVVKLSELPEAKQKAIKLVLSVHDEKTNLQENDTMKDIMEMIDKLPAEQKAELTAKLAAGSKSSDKPGASQDQQLSEEALKKQNLELTEKLATVETENLKNKKEGEYALLLSEGKIVPAAKDAYLAGDMNKVLELNQASDLNLDESGDGTPAKDGKDKKDKILTAEQAEDKIIKLSDEYAEKNKVPITDATKIIRKENQDLVKLSEGETVENGESSTDK